MAHDGTKMARWIRRALSVDELSPEEYAARYSHTITCLGFRYEDHLDDELEVWLSELRSILDDEQRLQSLRKQFLSANELKQVEIDLQEDP